MLFRTVVMMFVADFVPRVWAGFEALGLRKAGNGGAVDWDHDSDPTDALLNGFLPAVARMRGLDPVTTEVVRLRGAAQHNCRLCKSRRETNALDSGGSEDLYGEIEQYESSEQLTDAHKAALRFVDAMIWTPSQISTDLAAGVRKHFSEDQAFELTLDIMRNARQQDHGVAGGGRPAGDGWHGVVLRGRRRADGLCRLAHANIGAARSGAVAQLVRAVDS